jgi:hypothetical protein
LDIVADEGLATGVWLNTKAGTFARAQDLPLGGALAVADINTDGLPDLLQVSSSRNYLTLAYNQFGTAAAGDFTISVLPTAPNISAGDKTTLALTLGSLNGYAGIVTLACSGLPIGTTCTFSPAQVIIGGTAAAATVTFQTSLDSVSSLHLAEPTPAHHRSSLFGSGFILCGLVLIGARLNRSRCVLLLGPLAMLSLLMLLSCSTPNAVPPMISASPKSVTTMVTLSASAGTTIHSTQIALTITK